MEATPRVLVADDAPTVTLLVQRGLEADGWDVVVANDGYEAYELGLDGDFDLALVDHLMPSMLGAEIVQRWHEAGVETPVLILSGMDDEETVTGCLEVGAADFVRKPFNIRELQMRARLHARRAPALT